MPRLPRVNKLKVFAKPHAFELAVATFAFLGGIANAIRAFISPDYTGFWGWSVAWLWMMCAAGVLVFTGLKTAASYIKSNDEPPDGVIGALLTIHRCMIALHRGPVNPRLRLTIFRPEGDHLEQVVNYVGDDRGGGKAGRSLNCRQGVIGAAFRAGEGREMDRPTDDWESYVEELVKVWGFRKEEAEKISPEVRSCFAFPLRENEGEPVIGVLYADAVVPGFFNRRQQFVVYLGSIAIAEFAARRYQG